MLNENAQKWVNALRSGRYKQTKVMLTSNNGSCCLGVACEVAIESGVDVKVTKTAGYCTYDNRSCTLPDSVKRWLNLTDERGLYQVAGGGQTHLIAQNDSLGKDFNQIADIIESEPKGLFRVDNTPESC